MYSAPKNALEQKLQRTQQEASQPAHEQDRVGYAIITDINPDTSQVKVRLLKADGELGETLPGGFLPLVNPLEDIHLRFGALRKGLVCRIYWRGKLKPKNPLVEVIGDEGYSFLKKKPANNSVDIGPYAVFSGGLSF
jgi:hypothetical protein